MDAIRKHRLTEAAWLAVTLAILMLGFAVVAWEWRKAHTAASPKASYTTQNHHTQSNPPEVTTKEKHK